jgi:HYR domain
MKVSFDQIKRIGGMSFEIALGVFLLTMLVAAWRSSESQASSVASQDNSVKSSSRMKDERVASSREGLLAIQGTPLCVITCPANVTTVTAQTCPPISSTIVNFPPPSTSGSCSGVVVACSPPSGSPFPAGITTVTCTATLGSGDTDTCSFTVSVFNACLQDDARPGNVVLFSTTTGDYRFCCGSGAKLSGKGNIIQQGCVFTLQHNAADRNIFAKIDFSARRGNASLQRSAGAGCTISDTNNRDNTCNCTTSTPF